MDVIYISSGTEDDSDIEIVSVYNDTEDDSKDVLREWSSIPPPYIDLTDSVWEPLERQYRRREKNSVDWSYNSLSADFGDNNSLSVDFGDNNSLSADFGDNNSLSADFGDNNSLSADFGDDSSPLGSEVKPLSSALELATSEREQKKLLCHSPTESGENREGTPDFLAKLVSENWECSPRRPALEPKEEQKPLACLGSEPGSSPQRSHCRPPSKGLWEKEGIPGSPLPSVPEFSRSPQSESKIQPGPVTFAAGVPDEIPARPGFETADALRDTAADSKPPSAERRSGESDAENVPDDIDALSPWSPYYCPSEVDSRLYSDSSSMPGSQDGVDLHDQPSSPPTPPQFLFGPCKTSPPDKLPKAEVLSDRRLNSPPPSPSPGPPRLSPAHPPRDRSVSPTSTEILASDSPDWLGEDAELTLTNDSPASPWSDPGSKSAADSEGEELPGTEAGLGSREASRKDRQYVSRTQLNRLKRLMGRPLQELGRDDGPEPVGDADKDEEEEEEEEEPMCRLGLSLVRSAMEERCHDSMLQLLSDFLQPRLYPPPDVTTHLLRGILLDPESPPVLVLQAYSLLMRVQRNHPATESTVQWDWDLLVSAMNENGSKCRQALSLLLQYVVQTLHDDFHLRLRRPHGSIAKATLSCNRTMPHVRDVIDWLVATVKSSTAVPGEQGSDTETEKRKARDDGLKMLLMLQKMLALAVEVDCSPTTSSNKISEALLQVLMSSALHRPHRQLLLRTLESRLLQCKLVELLLQQGCTEQTELPMSLSLILHFLRSATLHAEPTDGEEGWRRWRELLQLLWMLVLSYQEVTDGHLRRPITQRAGCSHPPIWTTHDDITRVELQEASEHFLSRASADLGPTPPPQVQELLSHLREHLLCFCTH